MKRSILKFAERFDNDLCKLKQGNLGLAYLLDEYWPEIPNTNTNTNTDATTKANTNISANSKDNTDVEFERQDLRQRLLAKLLSTGTVTQGSTSSAFVMTPEEMLKVCVCVRVCVCYCVIVNNLASKAALLTKLGLLHLVWHCIDSLLRQMEHRNGE